MGLIIAGRADERLLAETLAHRPREKESEGAAHAARAAAALEGSVETKLIAYFEALPEAAAGKRALARQLGLLRLVVTMLTLAAILAGGATAATLLGPGGGVAVNLFAALAGLLGLHLVTFLLWLAALALLRRHAGEHSLGAAAIAVWRRLLRMRAGDGGTHEGAGRALMHRLMAPPAGRWTASAVSHALWLAYLLGAAGMALIVLSTQHVVFVWETTILSAADYVRAIRALSAVPAALGFPTPDGAAIAAAEWRGGAVPGPQDRAAWSGLLMGSLAAYGLLPRLLALAVSILLARRMAARPLDLADPAFARLVPALAPVMRRSDIVDAVEGEGQGGTAELSAPQAPAADPGPPPPGPVAVIGWEIAEPDCGWPPSAAGAALLDLGLRERRGELVAAAEEARRAGAGRLVIVADLVATPDRGVTAALAPVIKTIGADAAILLLTREEAARRRLGTAGARERIADWVAAAHRAGLRLDHILALDLDTLDAADRRRLARLLGGADGG